MVPALRLSAALVGALMLILLLPSGAAAGESSRFIDLTARGNADGHDFQLVAFRGEGERARVGLFIKSENRAAVGRPRLLTGYFPLKPRVDRADIARRRVVSGLGERGFVRMRFRADRTRVGRREGCVQQVIRHGTLVGRLRFQGEEGYVHLDERRIEAKQIVTIQRPRGRCTRRSAGDSQAQAEPVLLIACTERVFLSAAVRASGRTNYLMLGPLGQRDRGLARFSLARVRGVAGEFTYAPDLSSATIAPPPPFKGVGTYADGALSGDLRFNVPTTGRIPITPASAGLGPEADPECEFLLQFDRALARAARAVVAREFSRLTPSGRVASYVR